MVRAHRRFPSKPRSSAQGADPHILDAIIGAVHPARDLGEAQAFDVPQHDHLAIPHRQRLDRFGQPCGLLALEGPLGRRGVRRDGIPRQVPHRIIRVEDQPPLPTQVTPPRAEIMTYLVQQDRVQDLPQPAQEFALRAAAELADVPVRLERDLLQHVLDVHLHPEAATDLAPGLFRQRIPVAVEQTDQGGATARLGEDQ